MVQVATIHEASSLASVAGLSAYRSPLLRAAADLGSSRTETIVGGGERGIDRVFAGELVKLSFLNQ